jgi:3-oxoadipate enol-lactonase
MSLATLRGHPFEYTQSGNGPNLLLVHSLLTDETVFDRVRPSLAVTHRVTTINLPGFGASKPVELNSVADYADWLAEAMDALRLPKWTDVFGNGFGAFVVLELAIRHGARMGNVIVADVVPAFAEAAKLPFRMMAAKVREGGMPTILDTAVGRMFPPAFQASSPDVVAFRRERLARVDAESFARACLGLAELDLTPHLGSIRNRTLVMCGSLDQTTPPALARQVAAAIPGAQYKEIEGSGHCPMLEQPETLVQAVRTFADAPAKAQND